MDNFLSLLGLGDNNAKSNKSNESTKSNFQDKLQDLQERINNIVSNLLIPYLEPEKSSEHHYADLLKLVNVDKCNDYAIFLSKQLGKQFTKLELQQFDEEVYAGRISGKQNNNSNINAKNIVGKNSNYSKKQLCDSIAVHYIKIINLIASILTAVNPTNNVCLNKLRRLYTTLSSEDKTGVVQICKPDITDNLPLSAQYGIKQFLNLYYFHMIQEVETNQERTRVANEYRNLVRELESLNLIEDASYNNVLNQEKQNVAVATEDDLIINENREQLNQPNANRLNHNRQNNNNNVGRKQQEMAQLLQFQESTLSNQARQIGDMEERITMLTQLIEGIERNVEEETPVPVEEVTTNESAI